MKKLFFFMVLGILYICPTTAKTPTKSQLVGWWKLTETNPTSPESPYRKLYFSEDNYFFSATSSEGTISIYNTGQYTVFSDGKLSTIHQNSDGKLNGVASTYPIEINGDSLHLYGFYMSQSKDSPVEKYESILIDEWWVRTTPFVTPSTKATTNNAASINWIKSKTDASPARKPYSSQTFFRRDSAVCRGYISGFNTLHSKTSWGIVRFVTDELMNVTQPVAFEIQPSGRFEFTLPLTHMKQIKLEIEGSPFFIYMEPGQVLGMVMEWKDLFLFRGKNQSKLIQFYGPLATINNQLQTISKTSADYAYIRKVVNTQSPGEFFNKQAQKLRAYETRLSVEQKENNYSAEAVEIARFDAYCKNSSELFSFGELYQSLTRDTTQKREPLNESDYFSFLKKVPLNDPRMLISDHYPTFIDLFETSKAYLNNKPLLIDPQPAKSFYTFLVEDCNITFTPEEKALADYMDNTTRKPLTVDQTATLRKGSTSINSKYQTQLRTYNDIYVRPLKRTPSHEMTEIRWKRNDSTLLRTVGLSPNLTTEIVRLRQLKGNLKNLNKDDGTTLVNKLDAYLTHPFFKAEVKRLVEAQYSEFTTSESQRYSETRAKESLAAYLGKQTTAQTATVLPKGKATDAFKRIIDPFKGKLVFVDFWATTCGPCIGNIERLYDFRKTYANDPEIAFVFITDVSSSPFNVYEKFVKSQELKNSFRVSDGEYILFRNLFTFDGIPFCVLIDKDGNEIQRGYTGDPANALKKYLNR